MNQRTAVLTAAILGSAIVFLDATIVNVALERIQIALAFTSQSDLQWIVTGYALTFGGFLLLGGKLADRVGRRQVFVVGAVLFAVASLLGGLAQDQTLLIAARALQGLGGAFMSPAALSLLTVVFAEGKERDRALAALKELELDHRTGQITDEDYRALVGPLRRQAAEALRALEPRAGARGERVRTSR